MMTKLVWLTDIHLNFVEMEKRTYFYQQIMATGSDAILVSGDIADATSLETILKEMARTLQKPIYFVLGNHDYYHGDINSIRQKMIKMTEDDPFLCWLPASDSKLLSDKVVLVGQDCFADGRYGNYSCSDVVLNDSRMIFDLFQSNIVGKYQLLEKMQQLADYDAKELTNNIKQAICDYNPTKIMILIHVPPFIEACMYEGKISSDDYLPFFSSKVTGDVLLQMAEEYQHVEFAVFCGHTHHKAFYKPHPNLSVKVGGAAYGAPTVQEIFEL